MEQEPVMLQDCDSKLSKWLANTPHAKQHAVEAAGAIAPIQLELDLFPEGVIVTEGTLADWEEASNVSTNQEANHAVQRPERPRPPEGV